MRYFFDQEFIEGFKKPFFGKRRHFIDLVSIGIVAEDGREYYAISSEFNYHDANEWVQQNIIRKIYEEEVPEKLRSEDFGSEFVGIHEFNKIYGKPVKQIMREVLQFLCPEDALGDKSVGCTEKDNATQYLVENPPKLYAYYADYDWVLLCSNWGTMMDLPKGLPMYCRDLKQTLDERIERVMELDHISYDDAFARLKRIGFPVCENEHNALADARFNRDLYNFLQKL